MSNFETLTIIISGFAFLIAVGSFIISAITLKKKFPRGNLGFKYINKDEGLDSFIYEIQYTNKSESPISIKKITLILPNTTEVGKYTNYFGSGFCELLPIRDIYLDGYQSHTLLCYFQIKENMPDKAILEIDTTLRKEKYKVLLK